MTETIAPEAKGTPETAKTRRYRNLPGLALGGICVLGALLYGWRIWSSGWGNAYYSAAVKSMSGSFLNFVFGAYDSAGVVTVDKPPLALWPQVISTWVFGFHGWAVLLPQVLAGVAAIFLLHRTVRLWAGEHAALIAALVLAVTPITVAINRDNNPDTLLVLLLIAAAYAVTRAVRPGNAAGSSTRWLVLAGFLVGCGFLTKMMQAWIVLPVFALAYLAGSGQPLRRRLLDLLAAFGVALASSLWWVLLVDLWPGRKPYIGGSADGSAWNLVLGYNGLGRIFGEQTGGGRASSPMLDELLEIFGGRPSIGRMFNELAAGQVSWLLPVALLTLAAAAVAGLVLRDRAGRDERAGWVLWGGWLLLTGLLFSFAGGIWHTYYTTMLVPAIAAVTGAGAVWLWRAGPRFRWPAAVAVLLSAGWAWTVLSRDTSWHGWVRYVVAGAAVLALLALLVTGRSRIALGLSLTAILLAPLSWSVLTALGPPVTGADPAAGPRPDLLQAFNSELAPPGGGTELTAGQRRLLDYAMANSDGAEITLAIEGGAFVSAPFMLDSPDSTDGIASLGGFMGTDNVPTVAGLQDWLRDGRFRFALLPNPEVARLFSEFAVPGDPMPLRQEWLRANCVPVDPAVYGGSGGPGDERAPVLYDCRPR
ncbi:ArnT family glycosyltransferase [Amycolatopsis nigrescens]|uniref:ArnT family glycosyltransferase n=1 Tax=Amycolatopsis nigrescens TaxID=381445 RepID=UPI0003753296|nr:glycosyltransferase family 39 protein [Amycolatopsis nigrescens]